MKNPADLNTAFGTPFEVETCASKTGSGPVSVNVERLIICQNKRRLTRLANRLAYWACVFNIKLLCKQSDQRGVIRDCMSMSRSRSPQRSVWNRARRFNGRCWTAIRSKWNVPPPRLHRRPKSPKLQRKRKSKRKSSRKNPLKCGWGFSAESNFDSAEKVRRVFRGSSWPCPNRYACFFLERWPDFSDAGVAEAARFICSVSRSSKVQ